MGSPETGIVGTLHHMCFSFASRTMAADANQVLEELCDFIRAGDDDLARKFIENQNLLSVVNAKNVLCFASFKIT